jgi:hypothetical protein
MRSGQAAPFRGSGGPFFEKRPELRKPQPLAPLAHFSRCQRLRTARFEGFAEALFQPITSDVVGGFGHYHLIPGVGCKLCR